MIYFCAVVLRDIPSTNATKGLAIVQKKIELVCFSSRPLTSKERDSV
jgi:hypothetical protein